MTKRKFTIIMAIILSAIFISGCVSKEEASSYHLTEWKIAPSTTAVTPELAALSVTDADEVVTGTDYPTTGWIEATVPGTVLGNLVDNGIYDDLFEPDNDGVKNEYFGDNLSKIPAEDFDQQWWYSTDFMLPRSAAGKRITLTFKGISYIGDIYVNGTKVVNKYNNITDEDYLRNGPTMINSNDTVADYESEAAGSLKGVSDFETYKSQFIGSMRTYDIDITDLVKTGRARNNIKVKVTKPVYRDDLTYYWVDWNPQPADAMMGLTGDVFLQISGNTRLANPAVSSKVSIDHTSAQLNLFVDASNFTSSGEKGTLKAVIKDPDGYLVAIITKEDVDVPANAYNREIALFASEYPELNLTNPRLW